MKMFFLARAVCSLEFPEGSAQFLTSRPQCSAPQRDLNMLASSYTRKHTHTHKQKHTFSSCFLHK